MTFTEVQEVGFQIANGIWTPKTNTVSADTSDLGPLIELLKLLEANNIALEHLTRFVSRTRTLETVLNGNSSGGHFFLDGDKRGVGVMKCEGQESQDSSKALLGICEPTETCWERWDKFSDSLEAAAQSCGLSRRTAQGVAGVVQELQDNIFEHSYLPSSGILGFRHSGNTIEVVVADSGVGVLESFQKISAAAFDSHEQALRAVVYEHRSRFDAKDGHGNGLRQVFAQLATLHGSLRFRTGDVSLSIIGNNFTVDHIVLAEEPFLPGFFAHFMICPRGPA